MGFDISMEGGFLARRVTCRAGRGYAILTRAKEMGR
jgi:hypothetical protein